MTSKEIDHYINIRSHELSSDEILTLLDIDRHPEIFAFEYHNGCYRMWDYSGKEYYFYKRIWK